MKDTATKTYIYISVGGTHIVVAGKKISVRAADRAAQELRRAHLKGRGNNGVL